jgi:hypothetical protein
VKLTIALTLVMLGSAAVLAVSLDPLLGCGLVLLVAGTNMLGRVL